MLKYLAIACVIAGAFVYIPVFYQDNPGLFHSIVGNEPSTTVAVTKAPSRPDTGVRANTLAGRKHSIAMDQQGHFRDTFKLNGRRVDALIDTGATSVAINKSTARRIGLKLKDGDFKYAVETANGKTAAAVATIDRIQLGRIEARDVPALVLQDKALNSTLIGMSFLNKLRKFEISNNRLMIEQ